jgi:hypothetical protein
MKVVEKEILAVINRSHSVVKLFDFRVEHILKGLAVLVAVPMKEAVADAAAFL